MPFVDFPIECTICRGIGRIKPVSAFSINAEAMTSDCFNCGGTGKVKNLVHVNPMPPLDGSSGCIPHNTLTIMENGKPVRIEDVVCVNPVSVSDEKCTVEESTSEIVIDELVQINIDEVIQDVKSVKQVKSKRKVELDNAG